jgi:Fe-S-cluster containining protein
MNRERMKRDSMSTDTAFPDRPVFFDDGLRFECRRCGGCCTGSPGTVYVAADELQPLADFLEIDIGELQRRYLGPLRDSFTIREHPDGRCLFYANGCAIYPARPRQCATYPFWLNNLRSEAKWKAAARECPGIGSGKRFSREQILAILAATNV